MVNFGWLPNFGSMSYLDVMPYDCSYSSAHEAVIRTLNSRRSVKRSSRMAVTSGI